MVTTRTEAERILCVVMSQASRFSGAATGGSVRCRVFSAVGRLVASGSEETKNASESGVFDICLGLVVESGGRSGRWETKTDGEDE